MSAMRRVERLRGPDGLRVAGELDQPRQLVPPAGDEAAVPPRRAAAADVALDDDDAQRRLELAQADRGPEPGVAAAEDRDVRPLLPGERRRGDVRGEGRRLGGERLAEPPRSAAAGPDAVERVRGVARPAALSHPGRSACRSRSAGRRRRGTRRGASPTPGPRDRSRRSPPRAAARVIASTSSTRITSSVGIGSPLGSCSTPGVEPAAAADPDVAAAVDQDLEPEQVDEQPAGRLERPDRQVDVTQRRRHRARPTSRRRRGRSGGAPGRRRRGGSRRWSGRRRSGGSRRPAPRPRCRPTPASAAGPRAPLRRRPTGSVGRRPNPAPPGRRARTGRPRRSFQATAITTLLIACARRVPILRKRASRPPPDRDPDPEDQLVRARGPSGGTRPRSRSPRPSARRAAHRRRSPRRARAGPAACRRRATRWRCSRRACPGSGSGPRRSSPRPRRGPGGARGRRPTGGCPCTSSAPRA